MKTRLTALAAAAVALTLAGPSLADSAQLAANAGLSQTEASGLSLTEIAQAKFNRDTGSDDRQAIFTAGVANPEARVQLAANAGIAPDDARALSLTQIAAAKFNRENSDEDQRIAQSSVTVATRSVRDNAAWSQLAANAGLSDAAGLSLTEIAAAKFARDTYN